MVRLGSSSFVAAVDELLQLPDPVPHMETVPGPKGWCAVSLLECRWSVSWRGVALNDSL
jgi:hypothetical protein